MKIYLQRKKNERWSGRGLIHKRIHKKRKGEYRGKDHSQKYKNKHEKKEDNQDPKQKNSKGPKIEIKNEVSSKTANGESIVTVVVSLLSQNL
jgi:hypothetical protein